ncbi:MAG: N-acetyl-gamma-glutamyl-phosphate reductase [Thiotrichales bacterium]
MVKCGIVGATGYTGVELLRLLAMHPEVKIAAVTSRAEAGKSVAQLFPNLRGWVDLTFEAPDQARLAGCDVVFFATPNGTAMQQAPDLLHAGVRVIDLAADFRLKDPQVWEKWYGMPHVCPELLDEAVYGLPELNREAIRAARLIANPGCYPTATTLAALPLLRAKSIDTDRLIVDAKSGTSGAGRKAEIHTLLSEAGDNFKAYAVPGHRHLPEIAQTLAQYAGRSVGLTFVPHLLPMIRGIHVTFYASLTSKRDDLQALYESFYGDSPFVDVMPAGAHPDTRSCRGANVCRIAVHCPQDGREVVVLSVIDNLVKGAAGQAVQNMNLMLGFPEVTGLARPGLLP